MSIVFYQRTHVLVGRAGRCSNTEIIILYTSRLSLWLQYMILCIHYYVRRVVFVRFPLSFFFIRYDTLCGAGLRVLVRCLGLFLL